MDISPVLAALRAGVLAALEGVVLVSGNEWLQAWEAAQSAAPDADPEAPAAPETEPAPAVKAGARSVGLVVRLTPQEREVWHAAARVAGRGKTAAWVRDVVTDHMKGGSPRAVGADAEVARARAELARIGNNLNQLAHQANAGALGGPRLQYVTVMQMLEGTSRELGAIRDALRERS